MNNTKLDWQVLQPQTDYLTHFLSQTDEKASDCFTKVQARLANGLSTFIQSTASSMLMLVKTANNSRNLTLLCEQLATLNPINETILTGGHYTHEEHQISWREAISIDDNFSCHSGHIEIADWIESEQLFGCVREFQQKLMLEPGLIHRINGGTLIISLRTILTQPLMWLRLKKIFQSQQYIWHSPDETRTLPVAIHPMPLRFRLLIAGDRDALAEFQETEPELAAFAIYSEFEDEMHIEQDGKIGDWCQWVRYVTDDLHSKVVQPDLWPVLIKEGGRYTGDNKVLPLCPCWINRQLQEAIFYSKEEPLTGQHLNNALETRAWREGFLAQQIHDDILSEQIQIKTFGQVTGQVNGLSVVEFPGHPRAYGEPFRISCVVHPGDGEFTDVERKIELGGSIHAKGVMILQAWLVSQLKLDQQIPFSASLVFEQSYSEFDGDSASLAELCALISALASQPVNQHIAVTGSIDQFGNVQPVGGVNEKIEGFFKICAQRGLIGNQGVILPVSNIRHLSLRDEVVAAVKAGNFHLWAVSQVEQAVPLLMNLGWQSEHPPCLLGIIQQRINHLHQQDGRQRCWSLRLRNWFSKN